MIEPAATVPVYSVLGGRYMSFFASHAALDCADLRCHVSPRYTAYCPACRVESQDQKHTDIKHGRIEGAALTFLQQHDVITLDFQFRFMRQQVRASYVVASSWL